VKTLVVNQGAVVPQESEYILWHCRKKSAHAGPCCI